MGRIVFLICAIAIAAYFCDEDDRGEGVSDDDSSFQFADHRLHDAYVALQQWRKMIISDPLNFTSDWVGPDVCRYHGVSCASLPTDASVMVVTGIDLNDGDIAGILPEELGSMTGLVFFYVRSNRFCGAVPKKFRNLRNLTKIDLSNNRFSGKFPDFILKLPRLEFVNISYNEIEGKIPQELFDKPLDAIWIHHNRFSDIPPSPFPASSSPPPLSSPPPPSPPTCPPPPPSPPCPPPPPSPPCSPPPPPRACPACSPPLPPRACPSCPAYPTFACPACPACACPACPACPSRSCPACACPACRPARPARPSNRPVTFTFAF